MTEKSTKKETNPAEDVQGLTQAFINAQIEFRHAKRDTANPFFKSKYASFAEVWEAVAPSLAKYGLAVLQPITTDDNGNIFVDTILVHTSGEERASRCPVLCKDRTNPQAMGSAVTYARRYSLASLLGVVIDDDDGNLASGNVVSNPAPVRNATLEEVAVEISKAKTRTDLEAIHKKHNASFGKDAKYLALLKDKAEAIKGKESNNDDK